MKGYTKKRVNKIKDIIGLPLRILLRHDQVSALGLTSLLEERTAVCASAAQSPVLDIGCGKKNFFIHSGVVTGYGMDIYPFEGIDICADSHNLPFKKGAFKTISFVGSFNYMKNPDRVLREVRRVLPEQGVVLVTVTHAFWSRLRHAFAWWRREQDLITGEMRYGFSKREIDQLFSKNGFCVKKRVNYFLGISQLIVASPIKAFDDGKP